MSFYFTNVFGVVPSILIRIASCSQVINLVLAIPIGCIDGGFTSMLPDLIHSARVYELRSETLEGESVFSIIIMFIMKLQFRKGIAQPSSSEPSFLSPSLFQIQQFCNIVQ